MGLAVLMLWKCQELLSVLQGLLAPFPTAKAAPSALTRAHPPQDSVGRAGNSFMRDRGDFLPVLKGNVWFGGAGGSWC